ISHTRRSPISTLFPYTTLFRSMSRFFPEILRAPQDYDGAAGRPARSRRVGRGRVTHELHLILNVAVAVAIALVGGLIAHALRQRSEEHTSELQSRVDLVCRLLL